MISITLSDVHVVISEAFRGKQLGLRFIKDAVEVFSATETSVLVVEPVPRQFGRLEPGVDYQVKNLPHGSDKKVSFNKLRDHYVKCGFNQVSKARNKRWYYLDLGCPNDRWDRIPSIYIEC